MGLTRQAVQRVADDLHRAGLIEFFPNPDHARAKLMDMTDKGQDAYAEALRRQRPWVAALAEGLAAADLSAADRAWSLIADRQSTSERSVENTCVNKSRSRRVPSHTKKNRIQHKIKKNIHDE